MKVSQHEQKEDNENVNILANEIKSCKDFEYALREESALLFKCFRNVDKIKITLDLLASKVNPIQLNHYLCS